MFRVEMVNTHFYSLHFPKDVVVSGRTHAVCRCANHFVLKEYISKLCQMCGANIILDF